MERIEPGKLVEFAYELYQLEKEGEVLVYTTPEEQPEQIIFGVTQGVFVPLEQALQGKAADETFDVTMKAKEAFGVYDMEKVVELDKSIFEVDGKFDDEMVKVGNMLPMINSDGHQLLGKVLEITDTHVKMDFNHMLAGKDVRFKGKVLLVRDATPEELHPAAGCGCGCSHEDCSDGCGCDESHGCGDHGCGCH